MNISKYNFTSLNINKIQKTGQQQSAFITKPLQNDCFQRTTSPSFGKAADIQGNDPISDFLDSVLSIPFAVKPLDEIIDMVASIASEMVVEIEKRHNDETRVEATIEAFSDKNMKNIIFRLRNESVENLFRFTPSMLPILPLFQDAKIEKLYQIEDFVKNYNKANQKNNVYSGQAIEAVKIYGILDKKEDLGAYGELLLYLYNEEANQDNPDYDKLNVTTDFLKQIGVNRLNEFDEKFEHIKTQFNNFENISDKAEAIEYLMITYPEKITYLSAILNEKPNCKDKSAEKIYPVICDIVDYYYEKNTGDNLEDLPYILEIALSQDKIKSQALKQLELSKKGLKTPEQKIEFYRFLKDCDVTINDFNTIAAKSIIEDAKTDALDKLINKNFFTEYIQELKGCKKEEASELYKNFNDIINAAYNEATGSTDDIETLIEIIGKYKLKNADSFLRLYNDATKQNKKSITTEDMLAFLDLFNYSTSKNVLEDAKKQKVRAIDLLKKDKAKFEAIKPQIEEYMQNDTSAAFTGETALSIYRKNIGLFNDKSNNSVITTLQIISGKDEKDIEKQKQIEHEVDFLTRFFGTKENTLKFINANQIKFDDKQRETEYKENCIRILNALYDENHMEESKARIEYFAQSGFLLKSKSRLNELFAKSQNEETLKIVLETIADKQIPSISHLEKFIHEYSSDSNSDEKILEFLMNLPDDISFLECNEILANLKNKLSNLYIPIQITAENINNIDLSEYRSSTKIQSEEIADLVNKMLAPSEGKNFLTALPHSTITTKEEITAYKIAKELAFNLDNSKESYQNLTRLLGISKANMNLTQEVSTYLYIEAISKRLPQKFIDFINSDEWLKYEGEETKEIPNISLHARLRAIDRFILNGVNDLNELYTEKSKEELKSLFRSLYTQPPIDIKGTETKYIIVNNMHNSTVLETIFSPKGKLVTIVPKRK